MNTVTRASIATIIPLFNGQTNIALTVASVLAQTLQPDELILVDDGSTDQTLEIALLAAEGAAFTVRSITQKNARQSAARNAGAASTSCDFIAFLDQDDIWHPEHLERLVEAACEEADVGWTYSDFNEIDCHGRMVMRDCHRFLSANQSRRSLHEILCQDVFALPSASLIRRTAFNACGGFDPRLCGYEDDDLFVRMFSAGWNSAYVATALVDYRRHDSSSSNGRSFWQSRATFYTKMYELYANGNQDVIEKLLRVRLLNNTKRDYAAALSAHAFDDARDIANTMRGLFPQQHIGILRRLALALLQHPRVALAVLSVWGRTPIARRWLSPELRLQR